MPNKSANILGPVIKELRKQKKMTQADLSRITGIAQNTISNHENHPLLHQGKRLVILHNL